MPTGTNREHREPTPVSLDKSMDSSAARGVEPSTKNSE